jgi:hypothetical protein
VELEVELEDQVLRRLRQGLLLQELRLQALLLGWLQEPLPHARGADLAWLEPAQVWLVLP